MIVKNLTNASRTVNYQDGDLLEYDYGNGNVIRKHYYAPIEPTAEEIVDAERQWRDSELASTDWIVPITDHPQHTEYLSYRQELRDYPAQEDFPNGQRPVKP